MFDTEKFLEKAATPFGAIFVVLLGFFNCLFVPSWHIVGICLAQKKFFFDRNRLNVAISRAQCSSIILFNPKLLETAPVDYNEFRLINNFQKLMKYEI